MLHSLQVFHQQLKEYTYDQKVLAAALAYVQYITLAQGTKVIHLNACINL